MSSGIPLEFEAAKLLGSKQFFVSSDYSYSRDESGLLKDFSVDIHANRSLSAQDIGRCNIELLVECKYRMPTTKWLFLPSPIIKGAEEYNERSRRLIIRTLKFICEFSPLYPLRKRIFPFKLEMQAPLCYKGVEINISNGDVYDKDIKHGIAQLQYGLPRLITEEIMFSIGNYEASNDAPFLVAPFLVMPILLTTADIYVTKSITTMKDVERASDIADIADKAKYVVLYEDYGPDFERHSLKECKPLLDLINTKNFKSVNQRIEKLNLKQKYPRTTPEQVAKGIAEGNLHYLKKYFGSYMVCNFENFPELIDRLIDYTAAI